jgi:hypothetical protein
MVLFCEGILATGRLLQQRAGIDPEQIDACSGHIELGRYDVAVFKAFRVREARS